ncbi:MAG: hypothetical protein U9P49_03855, partial [Thermodesulfobacteriota bacterium]|nr:hypothetical protein [Thermodesulfobacteriota bacterium]
MTDKNLQMLEQAICDYLEWIKSGEYEGSTMRMQYSLVLRDFIVFVKNNTIAWDDTFNLDTLKEFRKYSRLPNSSHAIRGLSCYLFMHGRIPQPLRKPDCQIDLPDIYEQYLDYHEKNRQVPYRNIKSIRRVLACFHDYLQTHKIDLASIGIEEIDAFLVEF